MSDSQASFISRENWNPDLEMLVKKEGEQSQSLYWLHNEASEWASRRNDILQIPSIILASVTGFLSATTVFVPPIGIGGMSLAVGIMSTISSYYKYSQLSESHRVTALLYLKTYKNIEVELSLPVHQRVNAGILLRELRMNLARISEIAPVLPSSIIDKYNRIFKYSSVSSPIVTNGIDVITVCLNEADAPEVPIEVPKPRSWPSVTSQTEFSGIMKK
jgi:hypothetical protein